MCSQDPKERTEKARKAVIYPEHKREMHIKNMQNHAEGIITLLYTMLLKQ